MERTAVERSKKLYLEFRSCRCRCVGSPLKSAGSPEACPARERHPETPKGTSIKAAGHDGRIVIDGVDRAPAPILLSRKTDATSTSAFRHHHSITILYTTRPAGSSAAKTRQNFYDFSCEITRCHRTATKDRKTARFRPPTNRTPSEVSASTLLSRRATAIIRQRSLFYCWKSAAEKPWTAKPRNYR